ncbi:MAG: sigma-70 family RNA polymerase sigma factor [Candidatus Poribacteria bacterium]|nr:sigma-70 family RNA polymerase sigma factor [Candidatus Poribacteria bacterium]
MKNEDVQLIRRILANDDTAFTELVEKYKKPVHTLAWRKIGDFHIAEDITQDVFLIVYQRLHTLKDPNLFSGWLYVITTRLCATWLRKKRIQTEPLEDTETTMLQKDAYSHHVAEERTKTAGQEQRDVVKKLLAKLKESERTVMTLHYLGEMTVEEISRFLGVSAGTIKSRLQRARNRLQREETMIREALDHFQISPNLTDNILQEVAQLKPATPSASKPLVPWAIAASSAVLIILILGIGSQYLARFQPPYSLDSQAEMTVELVDVPVVQAVDVKRDVRNRIGKANALSESDNSGQEPNEVLLAAAEDEVEDVSVSKQKWIPSEPMFGSYVSNFHATPEGDLYTVIPASGKIYKLPANKEKWEAISDISTLDHSGFANQIIAKWGNTMYFTQSSDLFASIDDGKTWDLLYSWDNIKYYYSIELILTEQAFYMAFENGIFSSKDSGKTWKEISGKLPERIKSLVELQNTLFAGTDDGLYRLYEDGWKRMELPESIKDVYSVATNQKRIYVLAELSRGALNPNKVSRGHERGWGVFGTSNLGERWLDITPINAWTVNGFIPEAKLIAAGETLLLMERGMVRSTDGGITWLPPQSAATTPSMDSINSAVVMNSDTIYVGSNDGLYRSTDSGKSWDMVNITPDKDKVSMYDLIVDKGDEKGQNVPSTLYGRLGIEAIKTTDKGKSWMNVPVKIPMVKPHREQNPHINQIVRSDGVIYASVEYDENGKKVRLYHLSTDNSTFVPIQDIPIFNSDYFEPLKNALSRDPSIEHLQDNFTGAAEFFSQLVKEDFQVQKWLMSLGLRGAFAISGDTIYMEYNFKLFRWERGDKEWYDIKQEETVLSLDIAKKGLILAASGDTFYVGKRDGRFVVSFDRGSNWVDLTPALPFSVTAYKEIVFVGSTVYVSTDAGIITSDDGRSWRTVTDSEGTNLIMEQLAVDGTTLYGVNKKSGIYRLDNVSWKQIVSELPDGITSLAIDGNTLYVGSVNNGMLHFNLEK